MSFLNREQLIDLFGTSPDFITGNLQIEEDRQKGFEPRNIFQPSSVDIHVGEIYIPETRDMILGGRINPNQSEHVVAPGETVLIRTLEKFHLPDNIGALCFSPSNLALKAILITNTGHVDPGYSGRLHFTAINMGKDNHLFRKGDTIITMLFFKLTLAAPPHAPERMVPVPYLVDDGRRREIPAAINDFYPNLSKDFLNIDSRARSAARQVLARTYTFWIPVLVAVFAIVLTVVQTVQNIPSSSLKEDLNLLEQKVNSLESRIGVEKRLLDLENAERRREESTLSTGN